MTASEPKYRLFADSELLVWAQLADHLTTRMHGGEFEVEEALPAKKTLAEEYGVSASTVHRAITDLLRRKLVAKGLGGRILVKITGEAESIGITRHYWRTLAWEMRDNPEAIDILELHAPRAWIHGFRADVRREELSEPAI